MRLRCSFRLCILLGLFSLTPEFLDAASVTLAWDASGSSGVTGYRIHYGSTPETYVITHDAGAQVTGTLDTLIPGQRYFLVVSAYDAEGNQSLYSNEVSYLVPSIPALPLLPSAPTFFRVVPRTVASVPRMVVKWQESASPVPITAYALYKSLPGPAPAWVRVVLLSDDIPARTRWTDSAVLPGEEWCYMIRAMGVGAAESADNPVVCGIAP